MISILEIIDWNFLTYNELTKELWSDKIREARKNFKIYFDLENNDIIRQDGVKSQDIIKFEFPNPNFLDKWKFKCELWCAGGDWEVPVYYFKCQIIEGYIGDCSSYRNAHFIFIPKKTEGNYQLVPSVKSDGTWHAPNNSDYKDGIDPKGNPRDCWKALKEKLKIMVDTEQQNIEIKRQQNEQTDIQAAEDKEK